MDASRVMDLMIALCAVNMEDQVIEPDDQALEELHAEVQRIAKWLDEAFHADCSEDDYCDGCASCDAGMAIKHLRKIEAALAPFVQAAK